MPEVEDVINLLEIELDKRLQDLTNAKLVDIAQTLVANMDKRGLTSLISNEDYFSLPDIVKWLEKKEKDVLFKVLNEPSQESDMRQPVAIWLKQDGFTNVEFEVPLPVGGKSRSIDVCGFKSGLLSTTIFAVELKCDTSRTAIDKAFAQAKDNAKGCDKSYVAFSPFVYLKYPDVVMNKLDNYDEVGLLICDKMRVIVKIADPKKYEAFENQTYKGILEQMKR